MLRGRSGQWRTDRGWHRAQTGRCPVTSCYIRKKPKQHRFYLGHDETQAREAERRLIAFWTALERYFEEEEAVAEFPDDCGLQGEAVWEEWSLRVAKMLAKGTAKAEVIAPPPPSSHFIKRVLKELRTGDGGEYSSSLECCHEIAEGKFSRLSRKNRDKIIQQRPREPIEPPPPPAIPVAASPVLVCLMPPIEASSLGSGCQS